eukprot:m.1228521 g.1228521  ORF g.1228521 m.1228521 type:complete len:59 (-) comp24645_c0_seq1:2608-2784(-)
MDRPHGSVGVRNRQQPSQRNKYFWSCVACLHYNTDDGLSAVQYSSPLLVDDLQYMGWF